MLVTKPAVATDAGISLQLRNMRGEQLEFTKLEVGSGQYGQDEATEEALRKRTTLKAKKQQFGISSIDVSSDKTTLILSSMITNTDLKEGYTIRELGLYARIKDQPDTECLVSVSLAEIEDEIPPYNSDPESRILMKYQFAVSDSDTVSLSYEHDPVALVEDVDAKVARLLEKTKTLQSELENVKKELLGVVKQTAIVNNNTTTEAGFALDARQANPTIEGTLAANILQLNNDFSVIPNAVGNEIINITTNDYKELNIKVAMDNFVIPITTAKIESGTIAFRSGYYASQDENGMITVYVSPNTVQLVQAYKNGKDLLKESVVGVKYK